MPMQRNLMSMPHRLHQSRLQMLQVQKEWGRAGYEEGEEPAAREVVLLQGNTQEEGSRSRLQARVRQKGAGIC
jgi:phage-related tail protein